MSDVNWLLFFSASLTINAIPGADVVYVAGSFHHSGWRAAFLSATGLAVGYYFYVFLTWLGVTALIISIPLLYSLVQLAGAIYLMWMGYGIYSSPTVKLNTSAMRNVQVKSNSFLYNGLIVSILNPKVGIFFVSFFPQFIHYNSPGYLILVLGTFFCLGATFFNLAYCYLISKIKSVSSKKADFLLGKLPGIILMLLGLSMIWGTITMFLHQYNS
ncbi:LysE family translocator [Lonsdalea quercina]|uniref:LysE family translocator n=1 Tax=Lonsdalea quercina TaxID=71657 RepID=UPI00397527E1